MTSKDVIGLARLECKPFTARTVPMRIKISAVACTLPSTVVGAIPFVCDASDPSTYFQGCLKRNLSIVPTPNPALRRDFREFVRLKIRQLFKPLTGLKSFEEWLAGSNYTNARKASLRIEKVNYDKEKKHFLAQARNAMRLGKISGKNHLLKKFLAVESFTKREWYETKKYPRVINSRSDMYKVAVGPAIATIESEVFKLPHFIKHVPEHLRCEYIMKILNTSAKYFCSTDYRSFEVTIGPEIMKMCEFQLYGYMLQNYPELMDLIALQSLTNETHYRGVTLESEAIRMSGEMNTSLGNGFTNLMVMWFMLDRAGCDTTGVFGVFEGDDGLTAVNVMPDVSIAQGLGFNLDLQRHDSLNHASFCGKVFDVTSSVTVADPIYYMFTSGWTFRNVNSTQETLNKLQYVKGLSYMYQFDGSPVLPAIGRWLVRTSNYDGHDLLEFVEKTFADVYERGLYLRAIKHHTSKPISAGSRAVCETVFKVPVQIQLMLEDTFERAQGSVYEPYMLQIAPEAWVENYAKAGGKPSGVYESTPLHRKWKFAGGQVDPNYLFATE